MFYQYHKVQGQQSVIDAFFELASSLDQQEKQVDLILPDCTPGLLFVQRGRFSRINHGVSMNLVEGNFYLFGQKTKAVEYHFNNGAIDTFGLKLKPSSIFQLFGISAHEITNQVINVNELLGSSMKSSSSIPQNGRIAEKINYLQNCLNHFSPNDLSPRLQLIDALLNDIHHTQGTITIQSLATKYNIGYKKIERLFIKHVGLTPKLYARIIRFNHCVKLAKHYPFGRLTDVAYQNGFFDQTHFIKETKKFTGQIPSQLFGRKDVPLEKNHLQYLQQRGY